MSPLIDAGPQEDAHPAASAQTPDGTVDGHGTRRRNMIGSEVSLLPSTRRSPRRPGGSRCCRVLFSGAAADVIDGPRSVVFAQAANRMHTEQALIHWLVARGEC